ncbi:MAG: Hsp70 family protein [Erysipelotrichaceae bacterium]|nr:Hsp70 family protein [Erysipelotrichaceae bacterium]
MGKKVGIDLGTTYCAVAIYNERTKKPEIVKNSFGNTITPSVVQINEDGDIIVGEEAKDAFEVGESGCAIAFKRGMGSQEDYAFINGKGYTAEDLSAILLKELKRQAEETLHDTIDEAVITVPAYFFHKERQATLNAAKKAGLKVRMLINEPTAAALNYGVEHFRENAIILVYDLGGGTFDITLLQMGTNKQINCLKTMGNHMLGGKDWDNALVSYILNMIESETGEDISDNIAFVNELSGQVEQIKRTLSKARQAKIKLRIPDYGLYETVVTVDEFEEITKSLIDQTGTLCEAILKEAGLTWSKVTDILLVGGSTKMPQVSKYLQKISGHKPLGILKPDEAVALGAAIQTTLPLPQYNTYQVTANNKTNISTGKVRLEEQISVASIRVNDVQAHALGIIAVNKEGTYYENQNIIPANQEIPVKCARKFKYYTSPNEDNEVDVYLLQGTKPILECEILNKYVISGITHQIDPVELRIQYSYDKSGMVHVQARKGHENIDLPIREEPVEDDLSRFGLPIPKPKVKQEETTVLFVIDTSGSMDGNRIEEARLAIKDFTNKLSDYRVTYGLLAFSETTTVVSDLSHKVQNLLNKLPSLYSGLGGYGTDYDPFPTALQMLKRTKGKKYIVVLTDGEWYGNARNAIQTSKECLRYDIQIIAVGIGEADYSFLRQISTIPADALKIDVSMLRQSFGNIAQNIGGSSYRKNDSFYSEVETWEAVDE